MTVTAAADALVLSAAIAESIDNIQAISLRTAAGELLRKQPQAVEVASAAERKLTFYLTEAEGNGVLTGMSLFGNGATTAPGSGTEMCSQAVNLIKTATQSLLINWIVRVV